MTASEISHFYSKVVGVTFQNADGTSRQKIIKGCRLGEELRLIPEPTNPHDPNAVRVCRKTGKQLGNLSADLAKEIGRKLDSGWFISCFVVGITGQGRGTRGVNIAILLGPPGSTVRQMRKASKQIELQASSDRESGDIENDGENEGGAPSCVAVGCTVLLGGSIAFVFFYVLIKIFFRV